MKKVCSFVLSFCLMLGLMFYPSMEANAANVSLGVSASTINIGDTVTVTVSVPDNISATVDLSFSSNVLSFVSSSADVGTNGGTITMNIGKYSLAATTSVSVTFKADTSGTASVSASVVSAVDNDTAEEVSLGGASTSITVANQTPDTPDDPVDPVEPDDPPLSADNSLSSLRLSSGTLSPSFQYSVTNYTATVGYNVTSVVVSATTSNEKATIESVTGNGTVSLDVGENVIQIVVKAENGVKATYKITVTRLAQDEETTDPSESETQTTETEDGTDTALEWNGQVLQPAEDVPDEVVPADFEKTTIILNNVETPCLTFANGELKVLYLANAEGTEGLYVYDEAQKIVYPFVKIESEKNYVMVLLPDAANAPAPENYSACTLSVDGKGIINAYQFIQPAATTETTGATSWFGPETFYAAEPVATDFYLIYCMNNSGEKGWYVYDSVEGTFQRYLGSVHTPVAGTEGADPGVTNPEVDSNELASQLENAKRMQLLIICVSAFVIIVLIVIIVNLALKNRSDEEDDYFDDEEDDEYYDDDEYEFEEDVDTTDEIEDLSDSVDDVTEDDEIEIEFYEMPEAVAEEDTVSEDVEDDEIEIEFYEMTEEAVSEEVISEEAEDDEVEVEFYNMEELLVNEVITTEELSKKEPAVASEVVPVEDTYTDDDDDDDDLEFIELD